MGDRQATEAAPQEIERKFLVPTVPSDLERYAGHVINQGYLAIGSDGSEVRLRDKQGVYTQTVKTSGELVRGEWEISLTAEQFNALWQATAGKRIQKTRYAIPYEQHTIELDVFSGRLAGLIMAEVEFADVAAAMDFTSPEWFGDEVTADGRYKNKNLALHGLPD